MENYKRRDGTFGMADHIEAVQLTKHNAGQVAEWCHGQEVMEIDSMEPDKTYVGINLVTWEGMRRASEGDFILKDNLGDFHVRWPETFMQAFEKMED